MSYRRGAKLSTTYNVQPGDTFELVARKQYGTELEAKRIRQANPGVGEPLSPGITLSLPDNPDAPKNAPSQGPAVGRDEVALLIDGERFRFWEGVRIFRGLDSISTVSFSAPFEPERPEFRQTFQPVSFKGLEATVGGEPLFIGTLVPVDPTLEPNRKAVTVSGYSLPGVLSDCTPSANAFPIEFNDQDLSAIATAIAEPFGLGIEFEGAPGPVFETVAAEATQKTLDFLTKLAQQRNFVINDTTRGKLRFWQTVKPGNPVAVLRQGESPVISVTPTFNPQEYYSSITGIDPFLVGQDGGQFTIKNPFLPNVVRPFTFKAPDTEDSNLQEAVKAKMGRMFGNVVTYSVSVDTWRVPSGALWEPNTTLILTAPGAMIYKPYEFVIRSVQLEETATSKSAILEIVLPGAFSGEIPEDLPWLD